MNSLTEVENALRVELKKRLDSLNGSEGAFVLSVEDGGQSDFWAGILVTKPIYEDIMSIQLGDYSDGLFYEGRKFVEDWLEQQMTTLENIKDEEMTWQELFETYSFEEPDKYLLLSVIHTLRGVLRQG